MINNFLELYSIELWLITGAIFLIIEFIIVPNIGFLFLGLGALSISFITNRYSLSANYQFIAFAITSFVWFFILWIPLQRYIYKNTNHSRYSDMIGKEVQVYDKEITPGSMGQVKWSGVIMNAKLDIDEARAVKAGDILFIIEVQGNILICRPQNNVKLNVT